MTKSTEPYLQLIRRALARIDQYLPADHEAFLASPMIQDAILTRLQEIGENLVRIRSLDDSWFSEMAPDSWRKFIGLRNVISHHYEGIELSVIWQIITEELPKFATTVEQMIDDPS